MFSKKYFSTPFVLHAAFLLCYLCCSSLSANGQSKSNKGTEFWLGFMFHFEGSSAGHSLYITSDSNTSGTVSVPGENWSQNFTVTANDLTVVTIPSSVAYNGCSDCITTKGVKVVADDNIVVFAHQYLGNQSDATLVLPTRTLGKDYFAASYYQSSPSPARGRSTFLIVATKDSTVVRITPKIAIQKGTATASTGSLPANTAYQVTLDEGEIYQGYGFGASLSDDVTGTSFEVIDTGSTANCRKIAVFSGSSYASIGNCPGGWGTVNSGDNLYEQMYPINSWGKRFVLVPALGRSGDDFRFIAQENGTQVVIFKQGGAPDVVNLNKGQFHQIDNESAIRNCQSNKPIMVAQYQRTARCDGGNNRIGDPSMTILNPLEQTLTDITVYSSRFYDIDNHYINVVMPGYATNTFRLDGVARTFTTVPNNTFYSYARIPVTAGNHRLTASVGFLATAYGEGRYESYGYAAGANVLDLTAVATVSNSTQTTILASCIGRPTNFRGSAEYAVVRWEWDFGDGSTDTVQNPTHIYSDTGTFQAKLYTYKPAFDGCSNYDSAFVEVAIYPNPEARISKSNLCDSLTAFFSDQSSIPSSETKLISIWNIQGASALKYGNNVSHLFDTIGKYEVRMEVITTNQCRDTFIDSLVVNPIPVASFTVDDVCSFDTPFFQNTSAVSSGSIELFQWIFSNDSISTLENPSIFYGDSGQHFGFLKVTSDSGCVDSFQSFFYKYPRFEVDFTFNDTCLGFSTTFLNTTVLEGGSFTDTFWYTNDANRFANTFNYSDTFSSATFYDVSLVMEQDSFCRDTLTQRINIHPLAAPDFSFFNTCLGDSTSFVNSSDVAAGNTAFSSVWDFAVGQTSMETNPKHPFASGGVKNVRLSITTEDGCTTDTTKSVLITFPEITALNVSDICAGDSLILTADTIRGLDSFSNYTWNYGVNSANTPEVRVEYNALGTTTVRLNVVTKNGCAIDKVDSFLTLAKPKPNFLVSGVCEGLLIQPVENSVITPPAFIVSRQWYRDDVLLSSDLNPSFSSGAAGNRTIKLVAIANNGCTDSVQKLAVVHPLPISSYDATSMCLGKVNTLASTASIATGAVNNVFWTVNGSVYTSPTVTPNFGADGSFDIQLIAESDRGCLDTLNNTVDVHPLPALSFQLSDTSGCVPGVIDVKSNSSIAKGSITNYTYTWGDGTGSTADSSHTYYTKGTFTVKIVAESDQGCQDSSELGSQVTIYTNPKADFTFLPTKPSTLTEFVILKDSSIGGVVEWDWEISDGGMYIDSVAYHNFSDTGFFAVTLYIADSNGCLHDTTKFIYVNADLFVHVPNAFTPNGDGLNDYFGLAGVVAGVSKMEMQIYNRWGEKVFQSFDVNNKWDGIYKGEPAQQGVYIYKVKFTNPKQTQWFFLDGEIHLLRGSR